MHLLETYSHFPAVKPGKAFIDTTFWPIEFDKYVVVQASSGMPSKTYDYWEEVIEHIKLPTVQIGSKGDQPLPVTLGFRGLTNWNQTAFILSKASLFLGNDSVGNHMASWFGIPRIALFGPTSPLTCGGYWNKDKGFELTPSDMRGCAAPCHSAQCIRDIKCINTISVKSILNKIADVLGKDSVHNVDVLFNGVLSKQPALEWIPLNINQEVFNVFSVLDGVVSLRADLFEPNLTELSNFCNQTRPRYVVVMRPENLNSFFVNPNKVDRLLILADESNIKMAISKMKEFARKSYKVGLISKLPNEAFNDYKLDMLDFPPIYKLNDFEFTDEHTSKFVGQKLNIKTARKIIGRNGRIFLTIQDAQDDKNSVEITANSAYINISKDHLKELNYLTLRQYSENK